MGRKLDEMDNHIKENTMLEKEAVKKLYDRYYDEIYSYILKRVKKAEIASDIIEDVFIESFMMSDSENPEKFLELTKQLADNACKKYESQIKVSTKNKKTATKKVVRRVSVVVSVFIAVLSVILKFNYASEQGKITWIEWAIQRHRTIQMGMEGVKEEDFDAFALNKICGGLPYGTVDLLDIGVDEDIYRNFKGIDSVGYIVDGSITVVSDPEKAFFAAWIEVASEEYGEIIVEEMKQNLKTEEWSYVDPISMERIDHWDNVSVDDFSFYTNKEYIFVSYSSEEEIDGKKLRSSKEMEKLFDKMVEIKRNNY